MLSSLGMPELIIIFVIVAIWIVPVAAAVWALFTLNRVRTNLDTMRATLERVEQALRVKG
jgi:hypothetical protein